MTDDPLTRPVHISGADKPFGEVTAQDARAMAAELKAAGSWGPMAKVAAVARAWSDLDRTLRDAGAAKVAELDDETVQSAARDLWIIPPEQPLF